MGMRSTAAVLAQIEDRAGAARAVGRAVAVASLLLMSVALAACVGPVPPPGTAAAAARSDHHRVLVVRRGWHAGLVFDRADIAETGLMAEAADFASARLIEFGWDDREFYKARDPGLWLALRAGLAPTPTVLNLAPLAAPPSEPEVIALGLPENAFQRLVQAISDTFDRGGGNAAIMPRRGAGDRFYPAHGEFHLRSTCNTWTARVLASAGVDIDPAGVITADTLMRRTRASRLTLPAACAARPGSVCANRANTTTGNLAGIGKKVSP